MHRLMKLTAYAQRSKQLESVTREDFLRSGRCGLWVCWRWSGRNGGQGGEGWDRGGGDEIKLEVEEGGDVLGLMQGKYGVHPAAGEAAPPKSHLVRQELVIDSMARLSGQRPSVKELFSCVKHIIKLLGQNLVLLKLKPISEMQAQQWGPWRPLQPEG